jgi:hypothetical protein
VHGFRCVALAFDEVMRRTHLATKRSERNAHELSQNNGCLVPRALPFILVPEAVRISMPAFDLRMYVSGDDHQR